MATEKSSTVNAKPNLTLVKPASDFMETVWEMETDLDALDAFMCVASSDEFTTFSPEVQVSYLYGCNRLSSKIKNNFNTLFELHSAEFERKTPIQPLAVEA